MEVEGWRWRLRGKGAKAGGILAFSTPHFLEDPKNGS